MMRLHKYLGERHDFVRKLRPYEITEFQRAVSTARGEITKRGVKWRADTKRWREAIEAR